MNAVKSPKFRASENTPPNADAAAPEIAEKLLGSKLPLLPDIPLTPPSFTNTVPPPIFQAVIELSPGVNKELQLIPD